jgi:hypothetical protein
MSPLATLSALGMLSGATLAWAFRRMVDGAPLRVAVNRIQAHLLEFWIFVGEPTAIWKSWRGLTAANARLLRLLAGPVLILTIVTLSIFVCLDASYATSLLQVNRPTLVTLQFDAPLERVSVLPQLLAPPGIAVETPPVRIQSRRQVSWRIRPLRPLSGNLQWIAGGHTWGKNVAAGTGFALHSCRRSRSRVALVRDVVRRWNLAGAVEPPLAAGPIAWIEVSYPPATLAGFGIEMPWLGWFVLFSLAGALGEIVIFRIARA